MGKRGHIIFFIVLGLFALNAAVMTYAGRPCHSGAMPTDMPQVQTSSVHHDHAPHLRDCCRSACCGVSIVIEAMAVPVKTPTLVASVVPVTLKAQHPVPPTAPPRA